MSPPRNKMARNIKIKKGPTAPRPTSKRRPSESSDSGLSGSDGYSELDEAPESDDDDERDVTAVEEEHLITTTKLVLRKEGLPPRPPSASDSDTPLSEPDEEDEDDEDDEEQDRSNQGSESSAEDADAEDDAEDDPGELDQISWNGFMTDREESEHASIQHNLLKTPNPAERRVRFADDVPIPPSDSSTETDSDNENIFPDLLEQAYCTPVLPQDLYRGQSEVDISSNDSYWDFSTTGYAPTQEDMQQIFEPFATLLSGTEDETSGTTPQPTLGDLVGLGSPFPGQVPLDYDDSGDSTDTDDEAPYVLQKMKQSATEKAAGDSTGPESTDTDDQAKANQNEVPVVEHMTKHSGRPRSGKVKIDENGPRAIVVFDRQKKRLVTLTEQAVQAMDEKEAGGENTNPFYELPDFTDLDLANVNMDLLSSPAPNVMFGGIGIFPGDYSLPGVGQTGPTEAFFTSLDASTAYANMEPSSDELPDPLDATSLDLDIYDFLAFADDEFTDLEASGTLGDPSTPARPTTAGSEPDTPLDTPLGHLQNNADAVGAFRRNQANQNLILSDRATEESLAFSGPYHQGPIRGIKNGRLDDASVPISPVRRQKRPSFDMQTTPLAGQKRGAQTEPDNAHKKHRSISEVEDMRI